MGWSWVTQHSSMHLHSVTLSKMLSCEQYVPRRALRSGNKNYLTIPRYKLKTYGRRSFSVAAPLLWNSLPQDMRDATIHPEVFKKKLKTYFFKTAFNI